MKINDLLLESTHPLFETVLPSYHRQVMIGEELARALTEAALTAQQIQALFTQVQQQATAAGGNRTAIGKGVDAAKTVAKAYAGLKDLAQNSGPVKGFDAAFDKIAAELKQKTGGDQGAMKYVQKYRDFAKAHPVAQKVIYGALVMAVGVAAAGALGPAGIALKPAVIGLMRTTDKLLQGEKFSTAAIAGAETFAAGKIAQWAGQSIRNVMGGGAAAPAASTSAQSTGAAGAAQTPSGAASAATDAATNLTPGQMARNGLQQLKDMAAKGEITDYNSYTKAINTVTNNSGASGVTKTMVRSQIELLANHSTGIKSGTGPEFVKKFIELNGGTPDAQSLATATADASNAQSQMDQSAARMRQATGSAQPQGTDVDTPKSRAPKFVATAAAKAGVDPDEADFGMRHPGVDPKADLAAAKANLDTPDGVRSASSGPSAGTGAGSTNATQPQVTRGATSSTKDFGGNTTQAQPRGISSAPIEPGANTSASIESTVDKSLKGIELTNDNAVGTIDKVLKDMIKKGYITDWQSYSTAMDKIMNSAGEQLGGGRGTPFGYMLQSNVERKLKLPSWTAFGGNSEKILNKFISDNGGTPGLSGVDAETKARLADPAYRAAQAARQAKQGYFDDSYHNPNTVMSEAQVMEAFRGTMFHKDSLTESQVRTVFRNIEEGPWDTIKQAGSAIAGSKVGQAVKGAVTAAGQKIATGAENLTTKTTADKLNKAWQAAGSPMDSAAIYKFLQQQGIDDATLKAAFKSAGIVAPRAAATISPQYQTVWTQIQKMAAADKQKLIAYLQQQVGQQPATA